MQNELQRVLNLAKKTGDRVIVFDYNEPKNTYVVMDIDQYENMVEKNQPVEDLTEGELLDKINGDIAQWKNRSDFNISSVAEAMEDKPSFANATDGKPVSKTEPVKQQ